MVMSQDADLTCPMITHPLDYPVITQPLDYPVITLPLYYPGLHKTLDYPGLHKTLDQPCHSSLSYRPQSDDSGCRLIRSCR